jgi:histidine triad (HIT) family protein
MSDCLFCKIVAGDIPSTKVYEDEDLFAFEDINPKAPVHVLVIPKKHIPTLNEVTPEDGPMVGRMIQVAAQIARERGTAEQGYRTVFNVNSGGGQLVYHIHLHLLGGKQLQSGLG